MEFYWISVEKQRKTENFVEFCGIFTENTWKIIPFHSFSFLFIPSPPQITPILCSKTYSMQILLKFLAFFLAVPNILRTFANGYKTIVNYPARRPLSPMASSRRLFLCLGKSFFLTGKIIFSNWENRYAQYMAAAWTVRFDLSFRISHRLITNGECSRHPFVQSAVNGYKTMQYAEFYFN